VKYKDAGTASRVIAEMALALALYAPPSQATHQARVYEKQGRTHDAQLMRKMGKVPQAVWISGARPRTRVERVLRAAGRSGAVPVLVAYDLPRRHCRAKGYAKWIDGFADGIGAQRAIVILEPDALPSGCGSRALPHAVKRLKHAKRASVYVDAGHSNWHPAATMAKRLNKVHATAFSLNVSNFRRTPEFARYGTEISQRLGGAHFVIDTSRNGRGPFHDEWCNPPGRALGARPTTSTGDPLIDAHLWIKVPGESDGTCRGGPPAGQWWASYALGLARRSSGVLARSPGRRRAAARRRRPAAAGRRP
jgi:endoglucanase